jgi:hypothetical protein
MSELLDLSKMRDLRDLRGYKARKTIIEGKTYVGQENTA